MGRHYSERTLKFLFGPSSHCAFPGCPVPLISRDRGELTVLVQIAHIRSEKERGPRYDPEYPKSLIDSHENLLLLCGVHHKPVDDHASVYTVDELEEWKAAQIAQPGQQLSQADLAEILAQIAVSPISQVGAEAITNLARHVRRLAEAGRRERERTTEIVIAWKATYDRVRSSLLAWDADGERLYAEPSRREMDEYRSRVVVSLNQARDTLAPIADSLLGEISAISAMHPELADWCQWAERATRSVMTAASSWTNPPPFVDDESWPNSLTQLHKATEALIAQWRGEEAPRPPDPPPPPAPPEPDPIHVLIDAHRTLLDTARPWARVDHRPYDADLFSQLCRTAHVAASLPPTPTVTMSSIDLCATARLTAHVARNADDETICRLIDEIADIRPVSVASALLWQLATISEKTDRLENYRHARQTVTNLLLPLTWREQDEWDDNEMYAREVLGLGAFIISDGHVKKTLATALTENPALLGRLLRGCATWVEQRDREDWSLKGTERQYRQVPSWFPITEVVAAIQAQFPGLQPMDDWASEAISDETQRLAAEVLHHYNGAKHV